MASKVSEWGNGCLFLLLEKERDNLVNKINLSSEYVERERACFTSVRIKYATWAIGVSTIKSTVSNRYGAQEWAR